MLEHVYTTPLFLEDMGYDLTTLTANQRWGLIKSVSARIDALTGQWFNADYGTWTLDGKGSPLIQHKAAIPILAVESITIDAANTNYRNSPPPPFLIDDPYSDGTYYGASSPSVGSLDATLYAVHDRAIERIRSYFPGGANNVAVVGSFGWAEGYTRVDATAVGAFGPASTGVTLGDATGFSPRDVVDISGDGFAVRGIVTGVNPLLKTLTLDPTGDRSLTATIAAGNVQVRRLASVPRAIEGVAGFMFAAAFEELTSNRAGEVPIDPSRIRRERTDDYEYELFPSGSGQALITGSAQHDKTIQAFSRPGRVVVV